MIKARHLKINCAGSSVLLLLPVLGNKADSALITIQYDPNDTTNMKIHLHHDHKVTFKVETLKLNRPNHDVRLGIDL